MTEDQAKTRWCPFARVLGTLTAPVNGTETVVASGPHNRGYQMGGGLHNCACIASSCMAWRKVAAMFDRMTGEPAVPGVAALGDLEPRYTAHGYCGLAGPPS